MSSDHLPILIGLHTTATSSPARHITYINLKKADWTRYRQEIEHKLSSCHLPTDCQKDEKLFRATLLKAASHHIPTGRRNLYTQQVPVEILAMIEERYYLYARLQTTQHTSGGAVTADTSCCANCVEPSRHQQWGPDLPFFGYAGHADPLDGWRCCSQKRVMSRPIQVSMRCNRIEHWVHLFFQEDFFFTNQQKIFTEKEKNRHK